jgi:hypothetical protein
MALKCIFIELSALVYPKEVHIFVLQFGDLGHLVNLMALEVTFIFPGMMRIGEKI